MYSLIALKTSAEHTIYQIAVIQCATLARWMQSSISEILLEQMLKEVGGLVFVFVCNCAIASLLTPLNLHIAFNKYKE